MTLLQLLTGFVLGLGAVSAVFWFTFRDPPSPRPSDSATTIAPNADADLFIRNSLDDGHGGFGS